MTARVLVPAGNSRRDDSDEIAMLDYICDHWPKGSADASHLYENLGHQAKAIVALKGCGDAGARIRD